MNISSNPSSNVNDRHRNEQEYAKIDVVSELPGATGGQEFYNHDKQSFSNRSSFSTVQQPLANQFYTSNTANPSPASTANNTPTNRQSINNFMINNPATTNNTPQHSNLPSPALSTISSATNTSTDYNQNKFNFPSRRFSSVDSTTTATAANNSSDNTVHPYYTPQGVAPRRLNSSSNSAFVQVSSTASSPSNSSHPPLPPVSNYWKSRSNSLPSTEQMQNKFAKFNSQQQSLSGRTDCPVGVLDPREPVDPAFAAQLAAAEAEDEAWRKAQKLDDQHNSVPDFSDFIKG